jgi:hypothetical protein
MSRQSMLDFPSTSGSPVEEQVSLPPRKVIGIEDMTGNVRALAFGDFGSDDTEEIIRALHQEMKADLLRVVNDLTFIAFFSGRVDAKCLALETLSIARIPELEPILKLLIVNFLISGDGMLQFQAISAANNLSRSSRASLKRVVKTQVSAEAGSSASRVAAAFLQRA